MKRLLKPKEAAEILGIAVDSARNLLQQKQIQSVKIGSRLYTTQKFIDDFINASAISQKKEIKILKLRYDKSGNPTGVREEKIKEEKSHRKPRNLKR